MNHDLVLNDRYRLVERLATGGMGEVWLAADHALDREVAVKLLRRELMSDAVACGRFRSEARFAAGLRHSGIAQVYDAGTQDGRAYLVMELVRGEPLAGIIARAGALPPAAVLDLIAQAGRAMAAAHADGIVHRDIKPANLMVTGDGTVKITDFGIARRPAEASQTQTGMVMGTAYYISPEQASGQDVSPSADLYSLGVVAYECLTGRVPFDGDTPVAVALQHVRDAPPALPPGVPVPVRTLVGELLAKHPSGRPADADETADRALVIRDSSGITGPGLSRWTGPGRAAGTAAPPRGGSRPARTGPAGRPGRTANVAAQGGRTDRPASQGTPVQAGPGRLPDRTDVLRGPVQRPQRAQNLDRGSVTDRPPGMPYASRQGFLDEPWPAKGGRPGGAAPPYISASPGGPPDLAGELPEFDGNGGPDSLARGKVTARRRTSLTYASVAAGTLLLGVIVVGTMWRGLGAAEPPRENQEKLPAVQPGEGDPARHLPADPATRLHERRGQEAAPSPTREPRTTTPRYPRASPTHKPTRKPPRATPSAPDPTPRPTGSTTTPSTPSPDPSPTESGELGSEDKV